MVRIEGGSAPRLNSSSLAQARSELSAKDTQAVSVGAQVQAALFGRPKPPLLDPQRFPELAPLLAKLNRLKRKVAHLAGDADEDYVLLLADSTIAMIDEQGFIYLGAGFLSSTADRPEIMAGVLAHEIGHRPKRWREYRTKKNLEKRELEALCRHEETRADIFAGKAMAELEMSCEPMVEFLQAIEDKPHPEYFPAATRAEVIRRSHQERAFRVEARRKLFSEFDRMTSPKGHIGDF